MLFFMQIKELEVSKYFKFGLNDEMVEQNLNNLIFSKSLNSIDNLNSLLAGSDLNISYIKRKIEIELLWNNLIYEKYKNQLSIDVEKIKKNLKSKFENESSKVEEYKFLWLNLFLKPLPAPEYPDFESIEISFKFINFFIKRGISANCTDVG